jgi:hypothetical protein
VRVAFQHSCRRVARDRHHSVVVESALDHACDAV